MRQSRSPVCYKAHLCKMYGDCDRCCKYRAHRTATQANDEKLPAWRSSVDFSSVEDAVAFRKALTRFFKNQTRSIDKTKYLIVTSEIHRRYRMQIFVFDGITIFEKLYSKFRLTFSSVKQAMIKNEIRDVLNSPDLRKLYANHAKKLGPISNFLSVDLRSSQKSASLKGSRKKGKTSRRKSAMALASVAFMWLSPNGAVNFRAPSAEVKANISLEVTIAAKEDDTYRKPEPKTDGDVLF